MRGCICNLHFIWQNKRIQCFIQLFSMTLVIKTSVITQYRDGNLCLTSFAIGAVNFPSVFFT